MNGRTGMLFFREECDVSFGYSSNWLLSFTTIVTYTLLRCGHLKLSLHFTFRGLLRRYQDKKMSNKS